MKTYEGRREAYAALVTVNGRPLNPRLDLWNHSPTGFEWCYGGSGPAQLALALLAEHLSDDVQALRVYQEFKWKVVANLHREACHLTDVHIAEALQSLQ